MPLKINGAAITAMKYNGSPITAAKINGVALWPIGPAPLSLYKRMIALPATRTAVHFKTAADAQFIRYRNYPNENVTTYGTLLGEYALSSIAQQVPLVRGLELPSKAHIRLRQAAGDNTADAGGISTPAGAATWGFYVVNSLAGSQYIFIVDVSTQNWLKLRPSSRFGGSAGNSFINFFINSQITAAPDNFESSFDTLATAALQLTALQAWLEAIRTETTPHEMIIMITNDSAFRPTF